MALLALSCAASAACVAPSHAVSPPPVVAGQPAGMGLDGLYKGTSHLVSSTSQTCSPDRTIAVEVRDGRFRLPWQTSGAFDVRLRDDGTFYATSGVAAGQTDKRALIVPTAQGQVRGAALVADYGTRFCHYELDAARS